jgi:hypothetical protein
MFPRRRWAWRFDPQRGLPHSEVTTQLWEGLDYANKKYTK